MNALPRDTLRISAIYIPRSMAHRLPGAHSAMSVPSAAGCHVKHVAQKVEI